MADFHELVRERIKLPCRLKDGKKLKGSNVWLRKIKLSDCGYDVMTGVCRNKVKWDINVISISDDILIQIKTFVMKSYVMLLKLSSLAAISKELKRDRG